MPKATSRTAKIAERVPEGTSSIRRPMCAMFRVPTEAYTRARPNRKTMEEAMDTIT